MPKLPFRPLVAALAIALSLLTATACSSGGDAPSSTAPAPKTVKNASWSWTVTKVDYPPTVTDEKMGVVNPDETGTVFCAIATKITNLTSATERYTIHLADAFDAAGKDYQAWGFLVGGNDVEAGFDIDAGQEVAAVMLFQVPPGTTITRVALGDYFDGQAKLDLG